MINKRSQKCFEYKLKVSCYLQVSSAFKIYLSYDTLPCFQWCDLKKEQVIYSNVTKEKIKLKLQACYADFPFELKTQKNNKIEIVLILFAYSFTSETNILCIEEW